MAKKSKTQRAKASAARASRKEQAIEDAAAAAAEAKSIAETNEAEAPKKKLFKRAAKSEASADNSKQIKTQPKNVEKKVEKKPKKQHFAFLKDVRSELRRVTWPTKQDVLRWSGVVVVALVFFGVYVAVLDNIIITPLLVAISGLGA